MKKAQNSAFCSWSGGKESAMSLFRALQAGLTVTHLINMVTEDGTHSRTHGVEAALHELQAQAIGIPLVQRQTTWNGYEEEFKKVLSRLRDVGIGQGIFGDIDMALLTEFINEGFKAVIVTVDKRCLNETWIGREIDAEFMRDIRALGEVVDICGEKGEYHSFVYDGPIFNRPVHFEKGSVRSGDGYFFLDINAASIRDAL